MLVSAMHSQGLDLQTAHLGRGIPSKPPVTSCACQVPCLFPAVFKAQSQFLHLRAACSPSRLLERRLRHRMGPRRLLWLAFSIWSRCCALGSVQGQRTPSPPDALAERLDPVTAAAQPLRSGASSPAKRSRSEAPPRANQRPGTAPELPGGANVHVRAREHMLTLLQQLIPLKKAVFFQVLRSSSSHLQTLIQ